MVLSEGSTREASASKLASVVVGRIQFLVSYWTENLGSSLALGWRLPSVVCHLGLSKMSACFIKVYKLRRQYSENTSKREVPFFCK